MTILHPSRASVLTILLTLTAGAGLLRGGEAVSLTSSELIGQRQEAVLERLGPPDSIHSAPSLLEFTYAGAHDTEVKVALHEGLVFCVSSPDAAMPEANPIPATGAYLGQSLEDLLEQVGPPTDFTVASGAPWFSATWASGLEVTVSQGTVVGIAKG